jgi:p-aminobenzoyl-glutamate transporter AbgT
MGLGLPEFLIITAITVGIFLLFRNMNLWYFKINESIKLQQDQLAVMQKMLEKMGAKDKEV